MKLWEWIKFGLPTRPIIYCSGRIISFILGKTSFMQKLNLELSTSQIACTDRCIILMMWLASTFNVLTYRAAPSYVAGISTTSKSYVAGLRSTLNLPLAFMGLHTRSIVSAETYEVYISFTLFIHVIALWYIHRCTVRASILIQGWHRNIEAWPSEVGSLH